jgi:polyisoprenyl-phosphate glycosyltransferase
MLMWFSGHISVLDAQEFRLTIDIIIPVFNEEAGVSAFHERLARALDDVNHLVRFLYVNDGSSDHTGPIIESLQNVDRRVIAVDLSRNFGHQSAIAAGLELSTADIVLMMDGDGQHPPELIPEMIQLFEAGYDIVQAQRIDSRGTASPFKRATSTAFYKLLNTLGETRIIDGAADFRLLSRGAVLALKQMPEYHRFYRGMVQWIGFRSVILPYTPAKRIAGKSKYSLRKMLRLAGDGIFSFSLAPLRLAVYLGAAFLLLLAAEMLYILAVFLRGESSALVPGWSSLMLVLTLSSGISMLLTGILGVYVGMIFQEVKRRPVYLIRDSRSLERPSQTSSVQK